MWQDSLKIWHVLVVLGKLWYLYSGMQGESSMLNSSLKAQHSMQTHNATFCNNCMRKFAGREPGRLSRGVIIQHDNSTHTVQTGHKRYCSQSSHWDLLDRPSHRPDTAPSDYHAFGSLKQHLGCHWSYCYMTTWKQLFKNGCKYKSWNYTVLEFLNSCHDGANTTMCLGIMLEIITFQWNKWAAFNIIINSHLIFMN
jgi:hypothetical protein